MKNLLKVTLLSTTLALSGCATIISKSEYPISIQSTPSGAKFTIKNKAGKIVTEGVTPVIVTLKSGAGYFKGEKYIITFSKKGFTTQTVEVSSTLDGWYIGNIAFGGLLGLLVIDPITGAMYKLPETVTAKLGNGKEKALNIIDINTLTAEQRSILQKITL